MTMLGPNNFKKAIEEAEKLSESLKLRSEDLVVTVHNVRCNCKIQHQNAYL